MYEIYSLKSYQAGTAEFIKTKSIPIDDVHELCNILVSKNKYYHFRVHANETYTLFGDIDGFQHEIGKFMEVLQDFMEEQYNLTFTADDFKYTINPDKVGSFLNGI